MRIINTPFFAILIVTTTIQSMSAMDDNELQNQLIKIQTQDNAKLEVPFDIIKQSTTLINLLENLKEDDEPIPLLTISSETFGFIWLCLLKPQDSTQILEKLTTEQQLLDFGIGVDYLNIAHLTKQSVEVLNQRKLSLQETERIATTLDPNTLQELWGSHPARTWILHKYGKREKKIGEGLFNFSPDSAHATLHYRDGNIIRVFDPQNDFTLLRKLWASSPQQTYFNADGTYIVSCNKRRTKIWDIYNDFQSTRNDPDVQPIRAKNPDASNNLSTSDGKYRILWQPHDNIKFWETGDNPQMISSLPVYKPKKIFFSPDERYLIVITEFKRMDTWDQRIRAWDLTIWKQLVKPTPDQIRLFLLAYSTKSILPRWFVSQIELPSELQTTFKSQPPEIQNILKKIAPQYKKSFENAITL